MKQTVGRFSQSLLFIMLSPYLATLNGKRIVLASGSPRRAELLEKIGLKFSICPSTFEENLDKSTYPTCQDYVQATCLHKAQEVYDRLIGDTKDSTPNVIISADTIIDNNGVIIEKPSSENEARQTLMLLSGNTHRVWTAMTILVLNDNGKGIRTTKQFLERTDVTFGVLSTAIVNAYVDTKEPMDKAGSYGYQSLGAQLVKKIDGCFYNVVGLPLHRFSSEMAELCDEIGWK
eukprot:CFRG7608T1